MLTAMRAGTLLDAGMAEEIQHGRTECWSVCHGSVTVLCFNRFIPSKTFLDLFWPNNLPYQNCQHSDFRVSTNSNVYYLIIILRVIISFNECKREEIQRKLSVVSLVKRDFNLTFIQSQILSLILYKILLFSPQLLESNFRAAKETLMTNEQIKKQLALLLWHHI